MSKNVTIDGIEYAPVKPNGNRAVVVVDRGWIFAYGYGLGYDYGYGYGLGYGYGYGTIRRSNRRRT